MKTGEEAWAQEVVKESAKQAEELETEPEKMKVKMNQMNSCRKEVNAALKRIVQLAYDIRAE